MEIVDPMCPARLHCHLLSRHYENEVEAKVRNRSAGRVGQVYQIMRVGGVEV